MSIVDMAETDLTQHPMLNPPANLSGPPGWVNLTQTSRKWHSSIEFYGRV